MPPRFIPAEFHLRPPRSSAAARKEVSLPPDKPGGILEICVPFSRQKVNLRRVELGGIHESNQLLERESGLAVI